MSKLFSPKVSQPEVYYEKDMSKEENKPLKQVQERGRVGRTIIAGETEDPAKTKKKTILGG